MRRTVFQDLRLPQNYTKQQTGTVPGRVDAGLKLPQNYAKREALTGDNRAAGKRALPGAGQRGQLGIERGKKPRVARLRVAAQRGLKRGQPGQKAAHTRHRNAF